MLKDNIEAAKEKDKELHKEWEEQNQLSKLISAGNSDAYVAVLQHGNFSDSLECKIS